MPQFAKTFCSQCGGEFGPGDAGYSHCSQHTEANMDRTFTFRFLIENDGGDVETQHSVRFNPLSVDDCGNQEQVLKFVCDALAKAKYRAEDMDREDAYYKSQAAE
jgi:hypothetical protein